MKNPMWLIESDIFPGEVEPFMEALEELGVGGVATKFGLGYEDYIDKYGDRENVVLHSSIQFARMAKARTKWTVLCDERKYECHHYYPKFGYHLANDNYVMLPFGDLERSRHRLVSALETSTGLFIKSDSFKGLTGQVFKPETWDNDMKLARLSIESDDLLVVSRPQKMGPEWRLIIVDRKFVAGCQYKPTRSKYLPTAVIEYAKQVLDEVDYNPEPAWVLDICETEEGYEVLEVGPFSCCGFYECDPKAIITAVNAAFLARRK